MNRIVWVIVGGLWCCALTARGQGTLNFATKVTGQVDATMTYCGTPLGSDDVGQLYAGPPGGALTAVGAPALPQ